MIKWDYSRYRTFAICDHSLHRMNVAANCKFDRIEIYNGNSSDSELLGTTCTPDENKYSSSGNLMTVHFEAKLFRKRGFHAVYQIEKSKYYIFCFIQCFFNL